MQAAGRRCSVWFRSMNCTIVDKAVVVFAVVIRSHGIVVDWGPTFAIAVSLNQLAFSHHAFSVRLLTGG